MFSRIALVIEIAVVLLIGIYTVNTQSRIWQCGQDLALLKEKRIMASEKGQVLDIMVSRAEMPNSLRSSAKNMQLALVKHSESSFKSEIANLRRYSKIEWVQLATNMNSPWTIHRQIRF